MKYIVIVILVAFSVKHVLCGNGKKFIRMMTETIGRTVLECREVANFSEQVISEFLKFWDPDHTLKLLEMGCVVTCVMVKLDLVNTDRSLKINNAKAFAKANGADDEVIQKLGVVYDECKATAEDVCLAGLTLAQCFREKIFQLHWEPTDDDIIYDDHEL